MENKKTLRHRFLQKMALGRAGLALAPGLAKVEAAYHDLYILYKISNEPLDQPD